MPHRAFTLIELLVVIAIIGLLTTIAIVSLTTARSKGRIAAGQQSDVNIYQGLGDRIIGDWSLNETSGTMITDASGNNNGTLAGTLTSVAGVFGNALSFNGSTAVSINNQITAALNSFTVSAWFKTTSTGDIKIVSSGNQHFIQTFNGLLRTCIMGCFVGSKVISDGNWHFVVVTGDSTSIRSYLDGGLEITQASNSNVITDTLYIGACSSGYDFVGTIDQVRLYSGAMTAQAIEKLYAEGKPTHSAALAVK